MRDIGPVLKERKKIVKSVGRAEKKAGDLCGGLESKSVYKVMVRKEAGGRKARNQNTKNFSLISHSWWKMLDTFLCGAFPQNSYCVFLFACLFLFSVSLLYYSYLCKQFGFYY